MMAVNSMDERKKMERDPAGHYSRAYQLGECSSITAGLSFTFSSSIHATYSSGNAQAAAVDSFRNR